MEGYNLTLYTKSIYAPIEETDGIRVCVMGRLTQNDGQTPVESLITGKLFSYWAKILAPPPKVVGSWYRKEIDWTEFTEKYIEYLSGEDVQPHVRHIAQVALANDITLLCVEETPDHCHRRLLAEECKRMETGLELVVR